MDSLGHAGLTEHGTRIGVARTVVVSTGLVYHGTVGCPRECLLIVGDGGGGHTVKGTE